MADSDCIIVHEQVVVPDAAVVEEMVALPGEKGDKGDPFTYDDFTPEQIADLQRPATEAAEVANQAAEKANKAATDIEALGVTLTAEEAKRESAESSRASAESERAEAEVLRETSFSQMQTTLEGLITDTRTATSNANTAAGNAENAATAANNSATLANAAADKANQAAESIAYKENGFYISHAFLEATDLRYIGFKEIKNDKTCYLLTMGRCLKFSLDTYEVFWDVKLEDYGVSWHNAAEQLRVIDDTVYIICTKYNDRNSGIWLVKLNEEDGTFISEELIPIPVRYVYSTFKNKEVLITKDYIYGVDSVNKQILRCSVEDKAVEIVDSIDPAVGIYTVFGNRWITLPDGGVKYALVWISTKNHIKIVDEDNNLYSIELAFSNNQQITTPQNVFIHNINFKTLYINFIKNPYRHSVHLTDGGDNSYYAENIGTRNTYQNFPYTTEFYGNSMTTPDTIVSTNILSTTNEGFYRPITNKDYIFVPNYEDVVLAANLSTSRTGVRRQIEIINPI
jgi:hypothetical protein